MVTFGGFFEKVLVFSHAFFIWKGDAVDSLERVVFGVAEPVGSRVLMINKESCTGVPS